MPGPTNKPPPKKKFDLVNRGEKNPTLTGTLTFIGLRAIDLPIQHALLTLAPTGAGVALLSRANIATAASLPIGAQLLHTGLPLIDTLGHPTGALLLLMAAGSAVKQSYWQAVISAESFPPAAAAAIALLNTVWNGLNSLLFIALATTSLRARTLVTLPLPAFLGGALGLPGTATAFAVPLSTVVGTVMYVAGLTLETVSERQRKAFKETPGNEGKVCKVGAWRWARHINYFGYSLWRGGFTMVASGWVGGLLMTAFHICDLGMRAAGVLDDYCTDRYKEQWFQFKREVPSKIIPGIY